MKSKFNIGIDIDGVICDLVKDVLHIIRDKYGISLRKGDIYKHEMHEILGVTGHSFAANIFKNVLTRIDQPVIKDAAYYINKLGEKHNIIIVTSRPKKFNPITRKWFTHNKINYGKLINIEKDKHAVLERFDFFIDDHLGEIVSASSITGLKLLLFNQPWNKSHNIKNIFTRVKTWKEIYSMIKKHERLQEN